MAKSEDEFKEVISKSKVPILVLDNKWHRLFGKVEPTKEILKLQEDLSVLLKEQGKLVNENKSLKKIKADLMDGIVANMDTEEGGKDKAKEDKIAENKRLINEANEKLSVNEDRLLDIPRDIDEANKALMAATMSMCYDRLQDNTGQIEEIALWIKDIRVQLKKNILKKQDLEVYNAEVYSYMHDIFGPQVMELFDMKYVPTIHKGDEKTTESQTAPVPTDRKRKI